MDLRQLRYFSAVAEHGSFSVAAQRAHIAQSALSRHVIALEKELGVRLLERHARGVDLTESGTLLLDRTHRILQLVDRARDEVMARAALPAGAAVIGTTAATSRLLYGPLAQIFADRYPAVTLRLVEGVPYYLLEGLDTGWIDVAVMVNPEPSKSLILEPLVTERVYLIAARGAKLARGERRVTDLAGLPMILLQRPAGSRVTLDRAAAAAGVNLTVRYEVAGIDVLKDFVDRGLGYGLLPHSSAMADIKAKRFAARPMRNLTITRALVRRADKPTTPAVAALAGQIRAEIGRMIQAGAFGDPPADES